MTTPREKFQTLLRELFQFDCADLDFGIYRIMNHKRAVIEQFIEKDLLNAVSEELRKGALAQEANAAERLAELSSQIKDTLGPDALDVEGNLSPSYTGTKIGKEYVSLQQSAGKAKNQSELESQIFNHLYAFFSRYYDQGDFMSLRRYSKREKYAIPYNGEEVYLHWANSDQYYIKTGENFTDYSYKHGNWTVRFRLRNANVEQNNVKGAKRFFIPKVDAVELDIANHELTLPFEYRPLVSEEEVKFGKTNIQESIIADALPHIVAAAESDTDALAALAHEKRRDTENNPVSLLEHHLRTYTQKNTRDFFIHKDLKGFLERELDFFIKNEVLDIDDLKTSERKAGQWMQLLGILKGVAERIICFVSHIEELQRRVFEKRKFVIDTNYCVTIDRVPRELYAVIAKNQQQIEEWKKLLRIDLIESKDPQIGFSDPLTIKFLEFHSHLVLDTRFFNSEFKDRLLSSSEFLAGTTGIDDAVSGLLAHGDNFHILNLVQPRFKGRAKCIYLDPPYNTQKDTFPYKDGYKHSTWLTMLDNRVRLCRSLMRSDGVLFMSIDQNELDRLDLLLKRIFGDGNHVGTMVWKNARDNNPTRIAVEHEYILAYARSIEATQAEWKNKFADSKELLLTEYDRLKKLGLDPAEIQSKIRKFIRDNVGLLQEVDRYKFVDEVGVYTGSQSVHNPHPGGYDYDISHRETKRPMRKPANGYRFPWETMKRDYIDKDLLIYGPDENRIVQIKIYLRDYQDSLRSVIDLDGRLGAYALNALFGKGSDLFDNPKPPQLLKRLLAFGSDPKELIVDFFAGSGSTAEAAFRVAREAGIQVRYLFADMADYFDTVLKPRVIKLIHSEDWKDGIPVSRNGTSHAFKYIRVESYDDALDNIEFRNGTAQSLLQINDYVLRYMLDFETRESNTFLNVSALDSPFDYKLHRHGKDEPLPVDLPETFNYLIGLHVRTRRVYENNGNRYLVFRGMSKERETVVIWRTTRDWSQKEFEADYEFIQKQKLTAGAEDIFVNTSSFVPGAHSLDPVFKRLMFNEA